MIEPRNFYNIGKVDCVKIPEDNIILSDIGEVNMASPGSESQACYTMGKRKPRIP